MAKGWARFRGHLLRDNNLCDLQLIIPFHMLLTSWLERLGRLQVTQPLSEPVPANDEAFTAHTGLRKLGRRQLRRSLYLHFSGQKKSLHASINPSWRRGLWLYRGVPQIGDALMDLAPRSLLKAKGIAMDLCSEPHIAALFQGDPWFGKVFDSAAALKAQDYDFVIVQSYKSRSLRDKVSFLPALPWISIHGFYTGPEFHRASFAARRLCDALSVEPDAGGFAAHARQKLAALPHVPDAPGAARPVRIALALGGVDPLRTYTRWLELRVRLERRFPVEWTLLGSSNGTGAAKAFAAQASPVTAIHNLVGQTSLARCREAMQSQDVLVACDGGLMHLGVTTDARLVALFTATVSPRWRLPFDLQATALVSPGNAVDGVEPDEIDQAVTRLLTARRETKNCVAAPEESIDEAAL